jgi:hypothetical protein
MRWPQAFVRPNRVDGRSPQPNQKLSSVDQSQGFLLFDRAMGDRPKNLRIEPSVPCQLLRVHVVTLAVAVRDRSQLAHVGDDHLMAQLL